jgi:tripartite ATP-independent transporter DctM subunit
MVALLLFLTLFVLLLMGFPVAFTLAGVSIIFGLFTFGLDLFNLLPLRIYGTMTNYVLISVPLFVYMGVMLEKSGIAERLLNTMALLFGRLKGGLAVSVILVGALLAASTGVVGATVVTMGLLSLPAMLKRGYSPALATGTIAASGTLGQIIPPSVVLVLLGSVMNVSVGDLFIGAVIPGLGLVVFYLIYVIGIAIVKPELAPAIPEEELKSFRGEGFAMRVFRAFVLPMVLVLAVLGHSLPHRSGRRGGFHGNFAYFVREKTHLKSIARRNERNYLAYVYGLYYLGGSNRFWAGFQRHTRR